MHFGDILTISVAVLIILAIVAWWRKALRDRKAAPLPQHSAATGIVSHDEAKRLIHSAKGHDSY